MRATIPTKPIAVVALCGAEGGMMELSGETVVLALVN